MRFLVVKNQNLKKSLIKKIINLKKEEWKYSLKSHLSWFKKNLKKNDIHILLLKKNYLIGYNALRHRSICVYNNFSKNLKYYYFDTFVVKKISKAKDGIENA